MGWNLASIKMDIEQFVAHSLGEWRSMRSGHSLAFQQFEDVLSEISIKSFEIIESKNDRISMVSEDESLSELVDKKKMKEMQREVKLLEKKKAGMEKMYEKMCGKSYKKVVTEMDPEAWKRQNGQDADWAPRNEESNANSNEGSNENSNENSNDNKESYSGLSKFRTA